MLTRSVLDNPACQPCASRRFLIAFGAFVLVLAVGLEARRESGMQERSDRLDRVCASVREKLCDARAAMFIQETREPAIGVPLTLSEEIQACSETSMGFDATSYGQAVVFADYTTASWHIGRAIAAISPPSQNPCEPSYGTSTWPSNR